MQKKSNGKRNLTMTIGGVSDIWNKYNEGEISSSNEMKRCGHLSTVYLQLKIKLTHVYVLMIL